MYEATRDFGGYLERLYLIFRNYYGVRCNRLYFCRSSSLEVTGYRRRVFCTCNPDVLLRHTILLSFLDMRFNSHENDSRALTLAMDIQSHLPDGIAITRALDEGISYRLTFRNQYGRYVVISIAKNFATALETESRAMDYVVSTILQKFHLVPRLLKPTSGG